MPDAYQKTRYSHSTIQSFVSGQQNLVETTPTTTQGIPSSEFFKDIPDHPDGPVDLLYSFKTHEQSAPALGFQQVDSEQDEEQMYSLVYLNPQLAQAWKNQVG